MNPEKLAEGIWIKFAICALGSLAIIAAGVTFAHWYGSPVMGWGVGWFSALFVGKMDKWFAASLRSLASRGGTEG